MLLLFIVVISTNLFAQNWLRVDSVFAVTGVTVKSFSAPEFADLNNDGNLDLIIGNLDDKSDFFWSNSNLFPSTYTKDATVLENIYAPGQTHTNADYPTLIDIDGDGVLDLVIGGYNGLRYYKNIGTVSSPDFVSVDTVFTDVNTLIGTDPQPAFVDIDGDGDLDLFVGIGESLLGGPDPGITMGFRNTGTAANPQFTFDNTLVTGIPDIGLNSYPTFADLDNDGDYDLLFGRDLQTFVYYKNTGTNQNPIWTQNTTTFNGVETTTYWKNPDLVDIDYDSDFDLVYGTADGIMYLYRNIGTASSPSFQYYPDYFKIIKLSGSGGSVSLADFDGDGDNDLLSGMWNGKFYYFRNDGTSEQPSFNLLSTTPFSNFSLTSYSAPVFVDIDNDGDYDIVSGADNGQVFLYVNNNGTFAPNTTMFSSIDVGYRSRPTFADIDNDGDLDLLVGGETSGSTVFYINDGNNVFTLNTTVFSSIAFPSYTTPTFSDIDNDGDYDLINGSLWGNVTYYRNDGTVTTPTWARADSMFTGIEVDQSAHAGFADLDGDGRKDMILAEYNGNFTYYKNLFSPVTGVDNTILTSMPDNYKLNQNYPNPFNPSTTISFTIPSVTLSGDEGSRVQLKVYDILGNEIVTLVNEYKPAGSYEVRFDANGLSSGVYFYSLNVNGFTYSKSMMLLK